MDRPTSITPSESCEGAEGGGRCCRRIWEHRRSALPLRPPSNAEPGGPAPRQSSGSAETPPPHTPQGRHYLRARGARCRPRSAARSGTARPSARSAPAAPAPPAPAPSRAEGDVTLRGGAAALHKRRRTLGGRRDIASLRSSHKEAPIARGREPLLLRLLSAAAAASRLTGFFPPVAAVPLRYGERQPPGRASLECRRADAQQPSQRPGSAVPAAVPQPRLPSLSALGNAAAERASPGSSPPP